MQIHTGGVGRQALRITSELLLPLPPLLLLMVLLLWREDEQDEEGTLEVRVEEDEEECSEEYLGSGKLLCAMLKGCLLFRDIIIIFAVASRKK